MNPALTISGARPTFPEEDIPAVLEEIAEVLRSGRLILGPKLRRLESEWANRIGTKHAVGLSSCTAALEVSFRHFGVKGREVVIPTNTFVACANAAVAAGATVRFCDMNADDFGLDVDAALSMVNPKTAAILVVHIAGFVTEGMERLRTTCSAKGIALIEDCAHAHGATVRGKHAGAMGNAGCFSLYPTKVLTCGVGGVLTTDDDDLAAFARSLRHHGQGASLEEIVHAGNDWMLDEVRAVLATEQLRRLDAFLASRRQIAATYDALLKGKDWVRLPRLAPAMSPAYYKYPVVLDAGTDAREVRKRMHEEHGIEVGSLYSPPCHLMPVFRNAFGTGPGDHPVAEAVLPRQVCLPMHAQITQDEAQRSVEALSQVVAAR